MEMPTPSSKLLTKEPLQTELLKFCVKRLFIDQRVRVSLWQLVSE